MPIRCFVLPILVVVALSACKNVEGSTLYLANAPLTTQLCTLDQTTAAATLVGTSPPRIEDLASDWRPNSFRVWGLFAAESQLYRIDPSTGLGTLVGILSGPIASIGFDVITGQLYGATTNALYRIDPNTAASTLVGLTGRTDVRSIGFDLSGNLYGVGGPLLLKINTSTGAATAVGNVGFPASSIYDLAARPEDGKMFAVGDPFSSVLYTIDTNTAQATLVNGIAGNSFTVNNAYGLAFGPAVPEPSGFSLLLVTTWLSGIGRRRARRNH